MTTTQQRRNSPPVRAPPQPVVTTVMDTDDGGFPDDLDDDDDQLFMEIDENILLQGGGVEPVEEDQPRPPPTNSRVTESDNGRPKPKQLKIDGFMKPMPVIIKPPTPVAVRAVIKIEEAEAGDSDNSAMDNYPRRKASFNQNQSPVTGIIHPTVSNSPISYPVKVSGLPYIHIKQIKDNLTEWTELRRNVDVKVCVTTVTSKIEVVKEEDAWALTVCINDGTGSLHCNLSSELLNRIIGFDPAIMKRLKSLKTADSKQQIILVS